MFHLRHCFYRRSLIAQPLLAWILTGQPLMYCSPKWMPLNSKDPDGAIKKHFDSKGAKDKELHGLEFEPTYGFGEFLIHGIKRYAQMLKS